MSQHTSGSARDERLEPYRRGGRTTVLVIGGGINGIGVFRELALQGIHVMLVDRGDFASGASAASSHMVHGGIRYLENGELRLVRESVQERNRLLRLAPHRVRPLETTIPIFSTFSGLLSAPLRLLTHRQSGRHRERGALLIKVGLTIYDLFSRGGGIVPRHRFRGRRRSLAELPDLNPDVRYTATYFDAAMDDPERLALDVLLDGVAAHGGAVAFNYVEAIGAGPEGVRLRDVESGSEFTMTADLVINTTGPWTDLTNAALGVPTGYLGGTKGSHIVLDDPELLRATGGREIFFENEDGRIVLVYPLHGRVLVGTTDLEADPRERPVCTPEEVDYFVGLVRHVFPGVPVDPSRIVYTFSGIRPLPRHEDTAPGLVSREYRIESHTDGALGRPTLSLVGGKWTTFRAVAEHLADVALAALGRERVRSSEKLPLTASRDLPSADDRDAWLAVHLPGIDPERARVLLARYGARCTAVLPFLDARDEAIADGELSTGEIAFQVRHESVRRLSDVLLRRTDLAFRGLADAETVARTADALARELGWDAARRRTEIEETAVLVAVPASLIGTSSA